jgi:hypothetical protein
MDFLLVCGILLVGGLVTFAYVKYDEYKHQH